MKDHQWTYLERALTARFAHDAARFQDLAEQVADAEASIAARATALAEIAEWLDHVAGHPVEDSPAAALTEVVLVGLAERLCPDFIGALRVHGTTGS